MPASLHELRDELAQAGFGPRGALRCYAKFGFLVALAAACFAFALTTPILWAAIPVFCLGVWFQVSAVMCGHDGSHRALSQSQWVNDLMAWTAFTVGGGLSNYYWREKHNLKHHPFCNMAEKDPDIDQWPFALSDKQHARSGKVFQAFQHMQMWWFLPLSSIFTVPLMRWAGWKRAVRGFIQNDSRRDAAIDMVFIALHLFAWLAAPILLGAPWQTVLLVYAASTTLAGFYLTFIFAPAHMAYPLVAQSYDPLRLQLETTRNFKTSWFFRWTLIGLHHQIEHHISAKIPHFDLERAAPLVKAYCARYGLPYHEAGWMRSALDTHLQINRATDFAEIVIGEPPVVRKKAPEAKPETVAA